MKNINARLRVLESATNEADGFLILISKDGGETFFDIEGNPPNAKEVERYEKAGTIIQIIEE